jgi:hypothetical protein
MAYARHSSDGIASARWAAAPRSSSSTPQPEPPTTVDAPHLGLEDVAADDPADGAAARLGGEPVQGDGDVMTTLDVVPEALQLIFPLAAASTGPATTGFAGA